MAVVIKEAEAALGVPRPSRTTPNGGVRRHGGAERKPAARRASTEQPASVYTAAGQRRRRLLPTGTRRSSSTDSESQGNTRLAERQSGSDARGGSGSDCIGKCITRTSIFARGLYWRLEVRTDSLEGRWRHIECVASVRDFISSRGRPSARTTFRIPLAMATGGGSVCSATDAGATRLRDVHTTPGVWRRGGSTGPIHRDGIARRHPRNRNAGGQDPMSPAANFLTTKAGRISEIRDGLPQPQPLPAADPDEDDGRTASRAEAAPGGLHDSHRFPQVLPAVQGASVGGGHADDLGLHRQDGLQDANDRHGSHTSGRADNTTDTEDLTAVGGMADQKHQLPRRATGMAQAQGGSVHRNDGDGDHTTSAQGRNIVGEAVCSTAPPTRIPGSQLEHGEHATISDASAGDQDTSNSRANVPGNDHGTESDDQAEGVSDGPRDRRSGGSRTAGVVDHKHAAQHERGLGTTQPKLQRMGGGAKDAQQLAPIPATTNAARGQLGTDPTTTSRVDGVGGRKLLRMGGGEHRHNTKDGDKGRVLATNATTAPQHTGVVRHRMGSHGTDAMDEPASQAESKDGTVTETDTSRFPRATDMRPQRNGQHDGKKRNREAIDVERADCSGGSEVHETLQKKQSTNHGEAHFGRRHGEAQEGRCPIPREDEILGVDDRKRQSASTVEDMGSERNAGHRSFFNGVYEAGKAFCSIPFPSASSVVGRILQAVGSKTEQSDQQGSHAMGIPTTETDTSGDGIPSGHSIGNTDTDDVGSTADPGRMVDPRSEAERLAAGRTSEFGQMERDRDTTRRMEGQQKQWPAYMGTSRDEAIDSARRERGLKGDLIRCWREVSKSTSYGLGVHQFLVYCREKNVHPLDVKPEEIVTHINGRTSEINRFNGINHFMKHAFGADSFLVKNVPGNQVFIEFFARAKRGAKAKRPETKTEDVKRVLDHIVDRVAKCGSIAGIPLDEARAHTVFILRLAAALRSADVSAMVDVRPERYPPTAELDQCSKWRLQAYGTKEELLRAGSPNYWATLPHIEENPASTDQRYQTLRPSKWFMDLAGRTKFMQSLATSRAFENNLTFQGRQVRNRIWMQRTRKQRQQATVKMIYSEERDQQLSADRVSTIVKELLRTQMPEGKQLSQKFKPAHLRHAAASILYHGKMELAGTMTDEQVRKFMRHTSVYVTKQHYVPPEIPATIAQRWADAGPERYKQWCTTEWLFC